jgi:hypothetical protein
MGIEVAQRKLVTLRKITKKMPMAQRLLAMLTRQGAPAFFSLELSVSRRQLVKPNRTRAPRGTANGVSYSRVRTRRSARLEAVPVRIPLSSDAADLMPVAAALAELNDGELCALIDVTNNVPQIVPGLLAWIGHACDWELNRRVCVDFPLQTPDAAIPPEQDAASIAAMMTLRARFAQDARDAGAVVALFDAMIRTLTGGERRH